MAGVIWGSLEIGLSTDLLSWFRLVPAGTQLCPCCRGHPVMLGPSSPDHSPQAPLPTGFLVGSAEAGPQEAGEARKEQTAEG